MASPYPLAPLDPIAAAGEHPVAPFGCSYPSLWVLMPLPLLLQENIPSLRVLLCVLGETARSFIGAFLPQVLASRLHPHPHPYPHPHPHPGNPDP